MMRRAEIRDAPNRKSLTVERSAIRRHWQGAGPNAETVIIGQQIITAIGHIAGRAKRRRRQPATPLKDFTLEKRC